MSRGGELWPQGPVALPATVRLGDDLVVVRDPGPYRLLHTLASGSWSDLLPGGLGRRDRYLIAVRLYDPADALDFRDLWRASTALGGRLAGVAVGEGHDAEAAWWPAHRIAQFVVSHWLSFDGWCVRRGFDPHAAPTHRVIAAGWQFMIDHRPSEGDGKNAKQITVEALREKVWTPPGPHRRQVMRHTAAQERAAALAALRDVLPG